MSFCSTLLSCLVTTKAEKKALDSIIVALGTMALSQIVVSAFVT